MLGSTIPLNQTRQIFEGAKFRDKITRQAFPLLTETVDPDHLKAKICRAGRVPGIRRHKTYALSLERQFVDGQLINGGLRFVYLELIDRNQCVQVVTDTRTLDRFRYYRRPELTGGLVLEAAAKISDSGTYTTDNDYFIFYS